MATRDHFFARTAGRRSDRANHAANVYASKENIPQIVMYTRYEMAVEINNSTAVLHRGKPGERVLNGSKTLCNAYPLHWEPRSDALAPSPHVRVSTGLVWDSTTAQVLSFIVRYSSPPPPTRPGVASAMRHSCIPAHRSSTLLAPFFWTKGHEVSKLQRGP